jgi:hypothetical protein
MSNFMTILKPFDLHEEFDVEFHENSETFRSIQGIRCRIL